MAFATFYRYEFTDFPSPSSGLDQWLWRVSFLRDGYSGSIATIRPGDNPLTIEIDNQSDSRFSGAMAEKYNFELICDDVLQASQLYVQSDDEVQILIERDTTNTGDHYQVYSRGWLLASEIKEAYAPKPYPVTISGICGLSRLKSRPFVDETGKRLQGFVSLSHAIRLCLYWAGHSTNLYAGFNLYELGDMAVGQTVDGHADPSRCPLYQTLIRADWFLSESGTPRKCDEVLKALLGPVMRLEQLTGGDWLLVRADEAAGGWDPANTTTQDTVRVRHYTSSTLSAPPDSGGAASINLNLYTEAVIGETMVEAGSSAYAWKGITKPGIRVEQSFGSYLNKLPNPNFDSVDNTNLPTGWERVNGLTQDTAFRVGSGTEADPYRIRIMGISGPYLPTAPHVRLRLNYQSLLGAPIEYTKSLKRTLKLRFWNSNARGAQVLVTISRATGSTGEQYVVKSGGTWEKATKYIDYEAISTTHYYTLSGVEYSTPGPAEISIPMDGIDKVLELYIALYPGEALVRGGNLFTGPPTPYIEYALPRLEVSVEGLSLDGQQRTIVQDNKVVNETATILTLGDVPDTANPYDRLGTLYNRGLSISPNAASKWFWPDANILVTNPAGHDKGYTWIDWVTMAFAQQMLFPSDMISGNLIGRFPYKAQTVLHLFDIGQTVSSVFATYPFQIARWRYNVRDCLNDITAQIIPTEKSLSAFTRKYEWQTPNGPIPQNTDDTGQTQSPATSQYQSLNDKIKQISAQLNGIPYPKVSALVPGHVPIDLNTVLPKLSVLGPGNQVLGTVGPLHRKTVDLSTLFG